MVAPTIETSPERFIQSGRLVLADGTSHAIGPHGLVVGRDPSCAVVVDDSGISAVHAELLASEGGVVVRDLGSKNGIWTGAVRVREIVVTGTVKLLMARTPVTVEAIEPTPDVLPESRVLGSLYGGSERMRKLFQLIEQAAPTDLTVLIEGETGTGKEVVAQTLHQLSPRRDEPFVVIDCGSIPATLAESVLFGHERGSFTGAVERRVSPFLEAARGTVFLDELGELPVDVQPKLLRALAERRIKAVGATAYKPFDARVLAATRRELLQEVNGGRFRSDLYFRVAQLKVHVPALRERPDDIPGLLRHFLTELGARDAYERIDGGTLDALLRHDWPGNVRELRNGVMVALALAPKGGALDIAAHVGMLGERATGSADANVRGYHGAKKTALAQFERAYFARLNEATDGNIAEMSRRAGLQRMHVRAYLQKHGLRERSGRRRS